MSGKYPSQLANFWHKKSEAFLRSLLDRLDLKLLRHLQENNMVTADELSEQMGRSPSVIARRIRRLRAANVIVADVSYISTEAAGDPLFAIVQIQLDHHAIEKAEELRRHLTESENVQLCFEVAGTFDMLLLIVAADMDAFNALIDRLLAKHPSVRRYETSFVKKRAKATLALPIEELVFAASTL